MKEKIREFKENKKIELILIIFVLIFSINFVLGAIINEESRPDDTSFSIITGQSFTCVDGRWIPAIATPASSQTQIPACNSVVPHCCPSGQTCNTQTGVCEGPLTPPYNPPPTPTITSCSEFTTKTACESTKSQETIEAISNSIYTILSENLNIEIDDLNDFCNEENIFEYTDEDNVCSAIIGPCDCEWVGSENTGRCETKYSSTSCDIDEDDEITPEDIELSCQFSGGDLENKCDSEGIYYMEWIATLYDENGEEVRDLDRQVDWCQSGSEEFPCSSSVNIPFFTVQNIIFSLILITIIYFIIRKRK